MASFIALLKNIDYNDQDTFKHAGLTFKKLTTKAIRVFSPFSLTVLKPLEEIPSKWTIRHAMQVIANNQFEDLRCDGYYTDDYAGDANCNFRRGKIRLPMAWLAKIIEDPEGWFVYMNQGTKRLHICCHSFDSNSLKLNLVKSSGQVLKPKAWQAQPTCSA